jgi:hypothetical protein
VSLPRLSAYSHPPERKPQRESPTWFEAVARYRDALHVHAKMDGILDRHRHVSATSIEPPFKSKAAPPVALAIVKGLRAATPASHPQRNLHERHRARCNGFHVLTPSSA